jgi:hypothetical protein
LAAIGRPEVLVDVGLGLAGKLLDQLLDFGREVDICRADAGDLKADVVNCDHFLAVLVDVLVVLDSVLVHEDKRGFGTLKVRGRCDGEVLLIVLLDGGADGWGFSVEVT